jgi:hypothetical protein
VRIEICARRGAPPSGVVIVSDGEPRHFDGWLGLLGILADALDPHPPAGPAGRGSHLTPGGDTSREL